MSTVRTVTYDLLRTYGMTTMFGNPGSTELPFLKDFPEDITYILGLHEGVVVGMADGYAQGTGRAAFVNLHTAPGLGNAMAAIMTAYHNRTPLVIVAGQQDRRQLALEPFLSGRLVEMALPYVKWSNQPVRAEDVPAAIDRAYHTAMQAPRGPAFVSVPMDDWDAEAPPHEGHEMEYRTAPNPEGLARISQLLEKSKRPAIVAGSGAGRSGAWYETVSLAERLSAPVWAEPFGSQAGFPQDHQLFRGHLPQAQAAVAERLSEHDVVLVLGAPIFRHLQYRPGPVLEGTRLIQLTDDPEEAARAPSGSLSIMGDVGLAVRWFVEHLHAADRSVPPPPEISAPQARSPIVADYALHVLADSLPEEAVVLEEIPSNKAPMHEYVRTKRPGGYYSTASGQLGFAAAASVGLGLAHPERPVVAVIGDGSLMYAPQSLWSAARYEAAVVFFVINNGQYRVLKLLGQADNIEGVPGLDLPTLDIIGMARSLGCEAETVGEPEDLPGALDRALRSVRPYLVNVLVDPTFPKSLG